MEKTTQKNIKKMIRAGQAKEITTSAEISERFDRVAYSRGIYGVNGLVMRGESGQYYAIPLRCSALFYYL